jgi:tRNA-splicing ligase RtcB
MSDKEKGAKMDLEKIDQYRWRIPKIGKMKVPGIIYGSEKMLSDIRKDDSTQQVANVAYLPGIVKYSLAMPDVHLGYGFPIGGVAAFDWNEGVISPGGVGYDINCGCRLVSTSLELSDIKGRMKGLVDALFNTIPTGVGSRGNVRLSRDQERKVCVEGAKWAVKNGYGIPEDIEHTEEGGALPGANPDRVSDRAFERGKDQLGTLGSGNHFLEVGLVEEIFEPKTASAFGLHEGQVTILIHSGSRGFGYQICDDSLHSLTQHVRTLDIELPDRQLSCAYLNSPQGRDYFSAMACAANYAWANRQVLMHLTRETFQHYLQMSPKDLNMRLVYDVAHNIAKKEEHIVDGKKRTLCVHRKGATRAFPAGHPDVPIAYRDVGQPVLIPGDMGRSSYVMVGTQKAMEDTFGSCCHGAGRLLSRHAAVKKAKGRSICREMEDKGIFVRAHGRGTLAEEMPEAYKDISDVVDVAHNAGIAKKVAKLRPLGVIKG